MAASAMAADLSAVVPLGGGHCLKITAFPYHHNLMHARNVSLQITAKFVMLIAYIMIPYYILSYLVTIQGELRKSVQQLQHDPLMMQQKEARR